MGTFMSSFRTPAVSLSRLESLPAEVLLLVFDQSNIARFRTFHPISRTLRPYLERNHYRQIFVPFSKFLQLCRVVQGSPHLAALVKRLVIRSDTQTLDYQVEHEELVFGFLKLATALKYFSVHNSCPRLQQRSISRRYAAACYESLDELYLSFVAGSPALLRQTQHLGSIKALKRLYVGFGAPSAQVSDAEYSADEMSMIMMEEKDFATDRIVEAGASDIVVHTLSLYGHIHKRNLPAFLARFRALSELEIESEDDQSGRSIPSVLRAIDPTALTSLKITASPENQHGGYNVMIDRFVHLETLSLPSNVCSTALVTSLSQLVNFRSLKFSSGDTPNFKHIHALLDSRTKPPALKYLSIDAPVYFDLDFEGDDADFDTVFATCRGDLDSLGPMCPR